LNISSIYRSVKFKIGSINHKNRKPKQKLWWTSYLLWEDSKCLLGSHKIVLLNFKLLVFWINIKGVFTWYLHIVFITVQSIQGWIQEILIGGPKDVLYEILQKPKTDSSDSVILPRLMGFPSKFSYLAQPIFFLFILF